MIQSIFTEFFPGEDMLIYQSFPSIRFQFINNITVPPHYDSDEIGQHPIGERNFLLPITEMVGSKRLFIESSPGAADFKGIDLQYGELLYFNGNTCTHYNEKNTESTIRISLDFRVMTLKDYNSYLNSGKITITNPRDADKKRIPTKMVIGGYYQVTFKDDTISNMLRWHYQKQLLLQSRPNFDESEALACYNYMRNGDNFVTEYAQTEHLERMICDYVSTRHAIMTTSGNVALIIALMALNIGPGDEVIVPNYTMIASINAIKFVGATPIIIDVNRDSLTIDVDDIINAVRPSTRAVMHVSLNNRLSDIDRIVDYCKSKNISLVEDAAQSLGCKINGKHLGTFGEIGCFSLSTPKIISTGQGGFLVTDNDELARKIRMIKNFGRKSGGADVFETFGINFKFTDIQAVIGIEQMKKLPTRVERMAQIYNRYYDKLSSIPDLCIMPVQYEGWIPWFVDIFCDRRDELAKFLHIHNIQTRPTYPEINKTPMYEDGKEYPVSKWISESGLFLPSHTLLEDDQIDHICNLIRVFFT